MADPGLMELVPVDHNPFAYDLSRPVAEDPSYSPSYDPRWNELPASGNIENRQGESALGARVRQFTQGLTEPTYDQYAGPSTSYTQSVDDQARNMDYDRLRQAEQEARIGDRADPDEPIARRLGMPNKPPTFGDETKPLDPQRENEVLDAWLRPRDKFIRNQMKREFGEQMEKMHRQRNPSPFDELQQQYSLPFQPGM